MWCNELLTQVGDIVTATSDPTGTSETMCLCAHLFMLTDCLKCFVGIFQVQVKLNRQHLWSNVDKGYNFFFLLLKAEKCSK